MYPDKIIYSHLNDKEWINILMRVPPVSQAHHYFFKVKCASFLNYITFVILKEENCEKIWGEFYEFITEKDWYILRNFNPDINTSLNTYLSKCTIRYFVAKHKKEQEKNITLSENNISTIDLLNFIGDENKCDEKMAEIIDKAFERLKERDKKILKYLIIDGKCAIDIADEIWPLIRTKEPEWRKLPIKLVQDTISVIKKRAILSLTLEFYKIEKSMKE